MFDPEPASSSARAVPRLAPAPPVGPPRWLLYVDLDAYYVSCELVDRPELRGRPVIVGRAPGVGAHRGVVLSASYEARAFGVRSALPAVTAARLCPDAVWIAPDFPKYERQAEAVRAILRRFSDDVLPCSIDEAVVGLSVRTVEEARARAVAVQAAIGAELRLPSSIGVATSRTVAKIAVDRAKPAGILVVPPEEIASFLAPLSVRTIPGVGARTEELLQGLGVRTIGDLPHRPPRELERRLGSFARELIDLARGTPHEAAEVASGPRSRSTDRTFDEDATTWEVVGTALRSLALDLAGSLAREGLRYGTIAVTLRWSDLTRSQHSRSLAAAHEGAAPIVETALKLGHELWEAERLRAGRPVRTISVRAEQLTERTQRQRTLDEFSLFGRSGTD
jgi:nucleotidyltransferase/DNA polymerase involved in DNA repair